MSKNWSKENNQDKAISLNFHKYKKE